MSLRRFAILLLTLALAIKAVPCEAAMSHGDSRHDCCDSTKCPDQIRQSPHHDTSDTAEACCALAAQHPQQPPSPIAASVTLVPPVMTDQTWVTALPALDVGGGQSDGPPRRARSAPIHLLFSVLLI